MKTVYFECSRKGKVLAIIINDANEMIAENFAQFIDCESDRYIKVILEQDNITVCQTLIKFELDNDAILTDSRNLLINDMIDVRKIKTLLNNAI